MFSYVKYVWPMNNLFFQCYMRIVCNTVYLHIGYKFIMEHFIDYSVVLQHILVTL